MRVGPALYLSPSLYIVLFLFVYNSVFGSVVSLGLVPRPATWDRRTFWINSCRFFILFETFEK